MNATAEEAASQPDIWQAAIDRGSALRDPLVAPGERMLAIGCGTSAFVAQSFAALRERAGFGETDAAFASELPVGRTYDRVLAISRSGATTEILDALAALPPSTRRVVVTGVDGEAVDALADERILLDFADESSVVQTRFPTTVLALARAAFGEDLTAAIADGRDAVRMPLPVDPTGFGQFVFLGTGWTVGLAHEAALKVREVTLG
jgi:fructoselysine-6-P-deglycase FrlB-like protein